jgi:predicted HicB family RNase H-like nuclease
MNPHHYNIVVTLREIEGESIYEGRVLEFPDVRVYESEFKEAYDQVSSVIEDLIVLSIEIAHEVPQPIAVEAETYSGKMTFRPGKHLHRKIAEAASYDGISQNNLLCNLVSSAIAGQDLSNKLLQRIDQLTNSINQNKGVYIGHFEGARTQAVAYGVIGRGVVEIADVTSGGSGGMTSYIGSTETEYAGEKDVPASLLFGNARNTGYGQN